MTGPMAIVNPASSNIAKFNDAHGAHCNGKVNGVANGHANGHTSSLVKFTPNGSANGHQEELQSNQQSKSARALVEVRQKFIEYAEKNPDKVHSRDLARLSTDDWYLKRYLLSRNRDVNQTLAMLKKTMEWRNEFGIHLSEDVMFPLEFYKIGALFPYEMDKKGNMVLYMRIKYHRKVDELVEVEKHFLVHTFEKIDRITGGQGLVIVFDCSGAGYPNCDIEFLKFLISCATEHAPVGLQYIIVYKLPWVLNAFWSLAKKLLPAYIANRVRFCDENSVRDLIEPDRLPDFMGGTCRRNYRWVPPGSPSIFKLAHAHGITDEEIESILPQFQPLLDEADEALNNGGVYLDPPTDITNYINNPEMAHELTALTDRSSEQNMERVNNRLESMTDSDISVIRIFPNRILEFTYDAFDQVHYASATIYNPSDTNSVAFRLLTNQPTKYSMKPSKGVLLSNSCITINVVINGNHSPNDRFLLIARSIIGQIDSISPTEFDSLWTTTPTSMINVGITSSVKMTSYVKGARTSYGNDVSPKRGFQVGHRRGTFAQSSSVFAQRVMIFLNILLLAALFFLWQK